MDKANKAEGDKQPDDKKQEGRSSALLAQKFGWKPGDIVMTRKPGAERRIDNTVKEQTDDATPTD